MGFGEYTSGDDLFFVVTGYATEAADTGVRNFVKMRMPYDLWADSGDIVMLTTTGDVEITSTGTINIDTYNPLYAESTYSGGELLTRFSKWDEFVSGYLPTGILNAVNLETTGGIASDEDLRTLLRRHIGKVYMHYGICQLSHRRGIWLTNGLTSG